MAETRFHRDYRASQQDAAGVEYWCADVYDDLNDGVCIASVWGRTEDEAEEWAQEIVDALNANQD